MDCYGVEITMMVKKSRDSFKYGFLRGRKHDDGAEIMRHYGSSLSHARSNTNVREALLLHGVDCRRHYFCMPGVILMLG